MSKPSGSWLACSCTNGLLSCARLLVGAVTLLYLAVMPLVIWLQGTAGFRPAAIAALVSLAAGVAVLAVSHQPSLRKRPLVAMLVAMGLRMIPLLTIGLLAALTRDHSEHLGFVCYLVLFYLATLAVETYVSVQLAQSAYATLLPTREPQV